ncbi:hypothetical protein [Erwinia sp. S59]|uniref:hypothetical protein n=1 Tax=Erwinia sp. S59 TaxID=2769340 RepID=UPI001909E580|nr:hypothetical protein [Erwinia sp. S59]MBK0092810.1 hypothetical protein [Erwinia sp. S59]
MARKPTTPTTSATPDSSTSARARAENARETSPAIIKRRQRGELRDRIAEDAPKALEIIRKAMGATPLAKDEPRPDETAISQARYVIDKVLPPLRPVMKAVKFKLTEGADLVQMCADLLKATSAGKLDPTVCKDLISALTRTYQVVEVDAVSQEMAELRRMLLERDA